MFLCKVTYKYRLTRDHWTRTRIVGYRCTTDFIELYEDGRLLLRKNYCYDGASGPTWDDERNLVPAAEHDAKYQLMRLGLIPISWRKTADKELSEGIKDRYSDSSFFARKLGSFRAWYYYEGTDHFAEYAAKYGTEPKEIYIY